MSNNTLPPDLVVGKTVDTAANLWHLPTDKWAKIWQRVTGRTVKYGNIDTGVVSHENLPMFTHAKSFINGETVTDKNGHGTHTIGTSIGRNGIGVAPDAELHCVGKVLSNGGSGGSDGIAAGIRWCADQGCDVVNASLGGGGPYEPTRQAIQYLNSRGGIFVAAAGNAGYNGANTIGYPGRFLESICVGATQRGGGIANFSSGGRQLDIACPGQDIISTSHRGGFVNMSGTSMASPFMAGLFCLIIELVRREGHGELVTGVDAVRAFLERFAEDRGQAGKDNRYGYGVPRYDKIVDYLAADDVTTMSI